LLGASLATFGPGGLLAGGVICIFWAMVSAGRFRPATFRTVSVVALILLLLIGLISPTLRWGREAGRDMWCISHMKMIGLALHNYHNVYKTFPPAYVADKNGKPMHSWRVLLLPFLEQQSLYDKYDFNEPWDGPNNSKLADSMPLVYSCPSATAVKQGLTSYVAVVDPDTIWPGNAARTFGGIPDGTSNTVLVVEYNSDIQWLEPRDLPLSEALTVLSSDDMAVAGSHKWDGPLYEYSNDRHVALADGSVRSVRNCTGRDVWSALLVVNDGPVQGDLDSVGTSLALKRFKPGNCFRFGLFILSALLPLPWMRFGARMKGPNNPTPTDNVVETADQQSATR
jgi:hypothetical protein